MAVSHEEQQMIHQIIPDSWATPRKLNQDLARSFGRSYDEGESDTGAGGLPA